MNIGQRIREVREDLGMQQSVLARRAGVAKNHIWQIEHGERTPSIGLLERIARELRTEPAELLREPSEAIAGKAEARETGQPELEVELTNLWKSLLKRARTLRQRYQQGVTQYEGFLEDLERLFEDHQHLERLRKSRAGAPRAYHMESEELADAIENVWAEEEAISKMIEQDLSAPEEMKQQVRRFRRAG